MEQLPDTTEQGEKPAKVHYVPFNQYEETLLQYSTLQGMGYPVEIDVVHKSDPRIAKYHGGDNKYHQWEMQTNDRWAIITVDPELEAFSEFLDCPGDVAWTEDPTQKELLQSHPVKIIRDIDFGNIHILGAMYRWHHQGANTMYTLKHGREDYPWDDLYQRCIVAAADRYRMRVATNQPDMYTHRYFRDDVEFGLALADELQKEVSPINGEQLAGIIEDYYRTVGSLKPEFLALKK